MSKHDKKKKKKKKKRPYSKLKNQSSSPSPSPVSSSLNLKDQENSSSDSQHQSSSQQLESIPSSQSQVSTDSSKDSFGQTKPIVLACLVLFFGIQMYAPIRYYLGDYPWDERFSWRMFSTVRTLKCRPQLWSQQSDDSRRQPLRLSREMHMVWVNLMKRGRLRVVEEFARSYCQRRPETALYISLSCPNPTPPHAAIPLIRPETDLCSSPQILNTLSDIDLKSYK